MSALKFSNPEEVTTREEKIKKAINPLTNLQILACALPTVALLAVQFLGLEGLGFGTMITVWLAATIGLYKFFEREQNPRMENAGGSQTGIRRVEKIIHAEEITFARNGIYYVRYSIPPAQIDISWDKVTAIVVGAFEARIVYSGDDSFDFGHLIQKEPVKSRSALIEFLKNQEGMSEKIEVTHRMGEEDHIHHFSYRKV